MDPVTHEASTILVPEEYNESVLSDLPLPEVPSNVSENSPLSLSHTEGKGKGKDEEQDDEEVEDPRYTSFKNIIIGMVRHIHSDKNKTVFTSSQIQGEGRIIFHRPIMEFNMVIDGLSVVVKIVYQTDYLYSCIFSMTIYHNDNMIVFNDDECSSVPIPIIADIPSKAHKRYGRLYKYSSIEVDCSFVPLEYNPQYDDDEYIMITDKVSFMIYFFNRTMLKIWDVLSKVRTYKVCQYDGMLVPPEEFDSHNEYAAMKCFIEGYTTECTVCFATTKTHTLCNHPLCIKCWHKLRNMKHRKCPYCRKSTLTFMKTDADEEENE